MNFLTITFSIIFLFSSCNIKEAKNHDTSSQQSTEEQDLSSKQNEEHIQIESYEQLDLSQIQRDELWSNSMDNTLDMEERITSIEEYFISFNQAFTENSSHYTTLVLKNEIFKKLEFFDENIKKINKLNINKNHINTRRGKLKDIYIAFTSLASKNIFLFKSLIEEDFLRKTNKNITNHFLRNIAEVRISNALAINKEFELEVMTQEEIILILSDLEIATEMKKKLENKGYKFTLNRMLKNKIKLIKISDFQLDTNQGALKIQRYIDLFLN